MLSIYQDELRATGGGLAIPEAAGFLDPMRIYVRQVYDVPQIAGKKLLRSLIVLERALGVGKR